MKIHILILLGLTLLFLGACTQKKPNIVFIAVDDLRAELGAYGNAQVQSPNLDQLASQGALFTNHFVSVPTCGASRYSLLTGQRPTTRAHLGNDACEKFISHQPESEIPESFVHEFRRNGYYTVGIGKISHSADGRLYGYNDPVGDDFELPHSWDERLFDAGKWETGWNAFFGYADGSNRQGMKRLVKPYEAGAVDDMGYPDGLTAQLALKKLRELSEKKQQFLLAVGFFKPHLPFNAPQKYWDLYTEEELQTTPTSFIPLGVNKASLHESGEFNGYLLGEEKASLEQAVSDAYARKLIHAYYACISYIDTLIGLITNELKSLGLYNNTLIVVWGDHGWHLGDQFVWGKHTIFERALKSTLIISGPGVEDGGVARDQVVSTIDLYPTLLGLCGIESAAVLDGTNLSPLLMNANEDKWVNAAYSYYRNGISLRTERYRLTSYFRTQMPVVELYDHNQDPFETINVADKYNVLLDSLMHILEMGNTGLYQK